MYSTRQNGSPWGRRGRVCLLVTAGAALFAGGKVSVTNTSKAPWALRLNDGPPSTLTVTGQAPPTSLRWTRQGEPPVVHLDPGATATFEFNAMKGVPMSVSFGLIDTAGKEGGQLTFEQPPSGLKQFFTRFLGPKDGTVTPKPQTDRAAAADHWIINSDFWSDPW